VPSESADHDSTLFDQRRPSRAEARQQRKADKAKLNAPKPLKPLTQRQGTYIELLRSGESVIATGPAGTGKTYCAARVFARAMIEGKIGKLIITRVTVSEKKHALGFLPGKADAKMLPWLIPVIDGIRAEVSASTLEAWKNEGRFEIVPFEHMRGRTFDECGIILDEAQNASYKDLKLFLTRTGKESQVAICGDDEQVDVEDSGLSEIAWMAREYDLPTGVVAFTEEDVVRSAFAKAWVKGFARNDRDGRPHLVKPSNVVNLDAPPAFLNNGRRVIKTGTG